MKFENIDKRFEQINERFKEIEVRFDQVDQKFEGVDKRFGGIEGRLKRIEEKLIEHDLRFDKIESFLSRLIMAIRSVNEFTIDILGYEGVLKREAIDLIKKETKRVLSFAVLNPLTKYEKKRLKELLQKDEPTLEEAEELYEIADKILKEPLLFKFN